MKQSIAHFMARKNMHRKAKIVSSSKKLDKNTPVTVEIMENYLEPHFASVQEVLDGFRREMDDAFRKIDERLSKQDGLLQTILHIVTGSDLERQEMRSELWIQDKRISSLEKKLA